MKTYSRFFMILIILLYFYQVYIYQEVPLILEAQESPGEFRAFLVGTDEYKQAEDGDSFRNLNCCKEDVLVMERELLRNGYRKGNIRIVTSGKTEHTDYHPTKAEIERHLDKTIKRCGRDDVLFVYFACHGIRVNGKNYLVPYDGRYVSDSQSVTERAERLETLIDVDKIYFKLNNCAAKTKFLITDACQKQVLKGETRVSSESVNSIFQMNPGEIPEGLIQITPCSPGEEAYDGMFSSILLEGLRDKADTDQDGRTWILELFNYV